MITKQAQYGSMWKVAALCLMALAFLATSSPAATPMENGVPVTGLSAQKGEMLYFVLPAFDYTAWVDEGHLVFSLSGGTGDADLYVTEGTLPTPSSYEYMSENDGNEESCTLASSVSAWVYVGVYAYEAFSEVTLVGRYELGTELEEGVAVTGLNAVAGEELRFFLQIPAEARSVVFTVSGLDSGALSLAYEKPRSALTHGADDPVLWFDYVCIREADSSCEITGEGGELAGMWYAALATDESFSGVTLTARFSQSRCAPGPDWLCLNGGRFRVEVLLYEEYAGLFLISNGHVVPNFSADSGLFWFFSPDNWELLVKVVKGCKIDGHYWVFSAATTNVAYDLRVTDTETGEVRVYSNAAGEPAPAVTDTQAFATCP